MRTVDLDVEPLGRVRVTEDHIYDFPAGLPGFNQAKRFAFVDVPEYQPFVWMVAVDQPDLAFVTVDPQLFRSDYWPRLAVEDLEVLGLREPSQARMVAIVTIGTDPAETTANLRGPVVLNEQTRRGRQAILASQEYSTQQPLFKKAGATDGSHGNQGRRDSRVGADA